MKDVRAPLPPKKFANSSELELDRIENETKKKKKKQEPLVKNNAIRLNNEFLLKFAETKPSAATLQIQASQDLFPTSPKKNYDLYNDYHEQFENEKVLNIPLPQPKTLQSKPKDKVPPFISKAQTKEIPSTSSKEPRTSSKEPRTSSKEPRTSSKEPRTSSKEPRSKGRISKPKAHCSKRRYSSSNSSSDTETVLSSVTNNNEDASPLKELVNISKTKSENKKRVLVLFESSAETSSNLESDVSLETTKAHIFYFDFFNDFNCYFFLHFNSAN
jgi:hypothetical protein